MPSCPNCSQNVESGSWHEFLEDNRCRVKELGSNLPMYTSEKPKGTNIWGPE